MNLSKQNNLTVVVLDIGSRKMAYNNVQSSVIDIEFRKRRVKTALGKRSGGHISQRFLKIFNHIDNKCKLFKDEIRRSEIFKELSPVETLVWISLLTFIIIVYSLTPVRDHRTVQRDTRRNENRRNENRRNRKSSSEYSWSDTTTSVSSSSESSDSSLSSSDSWSSSD